MFSEACQVHRNVHVSVYMHVTGLAREQEVFLEHEMFNDTDPAKIVRMTKFSYWIAFTSPWKCKFCAKHLQVSNPNVDR